MVAAVDTQLGQTDQPFTIEELQKYAELGFDANKAVEAGYTPDQVRQIVARDEQQSAQKKAQKVAVDEQYVADKAQEKVDIGQGSNTRPTPDPQVKPFEPAPDAGFFDGNTGVTDLGKVVGQTMSSFIGDVVGFGLRKLGEAMGNEAIAQGGDFIRESGKSVAGVFGESLSPGAKSDQAQDVFTYYKPGDVIPKGINPGFNIGSLGQLGASVLGSSGPIVGAGRQIAKALPKFMSPGARGGVSIGTAGGVGEGLATGADVYDDALATTDEVIKKSPIYKSIRQMIQAANPDADEASIIDFTRQQIASQISSETALQAGGLIGITSIPLGAFLGRLGILGGKSNDIYRRGFTASMYEGAKKEGVQEWVQESGQQIISNYGMYLNGTNPRPISGVGVAEAGAKGLLGGGGVGAGTGALGRFARPSDPGQLPTGAPPDEAIAADLAAAGEPTAGAPPVGPVDEGKTEEEAEAEEEYQGRGVDEYGNPRPSMSDLDVERQEREDEEARAKTEGDQVNVDGEITLTKKPRPVEEIIGDTSLPPRFETPTFTEEELNELHGKARTERGLDEVDERQEPLQLETEVPLTTEQIEEQLNEKHTRDVDATIEKLQETLNLKVAKAKNLSKRKDKKTAETLKGTIAHIDLDDVEVFGELYKAMGDKITLLEKQEAAFSKMQSKKPLTPEQADRFAKTSRQLSALKEIRESMVSRIDPVTQKPIKKLAREQYEDWLQDFFRSGVNQLSILEMEFPRQIIERYLPASMDKEAKIRYVDAAIEQSQRIGGFEAVGSAEGVLVDEIKDGKPTGKKVYASETSSGAGFIRLDKAEVMRIKVQSAVKLRRDAYQDAKKAIHRKLYGDKENTGFHKRLTDFNNKLNTLLNLEVGNPKKITLDVANDRYTELVNEFTNRFSSTVEGHVEKIRVANRKAENLARQGGFDLEPFSNVISEVSTAEDLLVAEKLEKSGVAFLNSAIKNDYDPRGNYVGRTAQRIAKGEVLEAIEDDLGDIEADVSDVKGEIQPVGTDVQTTEITRRIVEGRGQNYNEYRDAFGNLIEVSNLEEEMLAKEQVDRTKARAELRKAEEEGREQARAAIPKEQLVGASPGKIERLTMIELEKRQIQKNKEIVEQRKLERQQSAKAQFPVLPEERGISLKKFPSGPREVSSDPTIRVETLEDTGLPELEPKRGGPTIVKEKKPEKDAVRPIPYSGKPPTNKSYSKSIEKASVGYRRVNGDLGLGWWHTAPEYTEKPYDPTPQDGYRVIRDSQGKITGSERVAGKHVEGKQAKGKPYKQKRKEAEGRELSVRDYEKTAIRFEEGIGGKTEYISYGLVSRSTGMIGLKQVVMLGIDLPNENGQLEMEETGKVNEEVKFIGHVEINYDPDNEGEVFKIKFDPDVYTLYGLNAETINDVVARAAAGELINEYVGSMGESSYFVTKKMFSQSMPSERARLAFDKIISVYETPFHDFKAEAQLEQLQSIQKKWRRGQEIVELRKWRKMVKEYQAKEKKHAAAIRHNIKLDENVVDRYQKFARKALTEIRKAKKEAEAAVAKNKKPTNKKPLDKRSPDGVGASVKTAEPMPIPDSDVKDGFKDVKYDPDKVLEAEKMKSEVTAYIRELVEMEMAIEARDPTKESGQIKVIEGKISKLRKDWLNRTLEVKDFKVRAALAKIVREEMDAARAKVVLPPTGSPVGKAGVPVAEPAEVPMTVDEENENLDRQMEEAEKDLKETLEDDTLTPDQQLAKWNAKLAAEGQGELKPAAATPKETIDLIKQVDTQNPKLTVANDKDNGATDDQQACLFPK